MAAQSRTCPRATNVVLTGALASVPKWAAVRISNTQALAAYPGPIHTAMNSPPSVMKPTRMGTAKNIVARVPLPISHRR